MATSRYSNCDTISGSYYATYNFPDSFADVPVFSIRTSSEDRLDTLAFKYLGDGTYWWVIAMLNNIQWAFDFQPGEILLIPYNVQDVLRYV